MRAVLPAASVVDYATPRPRRRLAAAILGGVIGASMPAALTAPSAAAQGTVELPVTFQVKNTDTSAVPCNSGLPDGATYTVSGHISGPQAALTTGNAHVITVYLFGYEAGEWN